MSFTLVLIPMAIAIAGSASAGTLLVSKSEGLTQEELDLMAEKIMQETQNSLGLELEEHKPLIIQTIMKNANILQEAAMNLGYESEILNKQHMKILLEKGEIIFHIGEDDIISATFSTDISSEEEAKKILNEIHDAYTTLVQQKTYQKLLEKIQERNLNLESEEVTKDNSIVLTLVVQE